MCSGEVLVKFWWSSGEVLVKFWWSSATVRFGVCFIVQVCSAACLLSFVHLFIWCFNVLVFRCQLSAVGCRLSVGLSVCSSSCACSLFVGCCSLVVRLSVCLTVSCLVSSVCLLVCLFCFRLPICRLSSVCFHLFHFLRSCALSPLL